MTGVVAFPPHLGKYSGGFVGALEVNVADLDSELRCAVVLQSAA